MESLLLAQWLVNLLTHDRPAMPLGNKIILQDLSSSVLSLFKKYHLLETWNFVI